MSDRRDWDAFYRSLPLEFYEAGDAVAKGLIRVAGWHVDPYCSPMCCPPDGPFPRRQAAEGWCGALADALTRGDEAAERALYDEAAALPGALRGGCWSGGHAVSPRALTLRRTAARRTSGPTGDPECPS